MASRRIILGNPSFCCTPSPAGCHFWSNFEIGRLAFFRSEAYLQFFEHLDQAGGFFYERWAGG
jgi:hypothetical protein